MPTLLDGHIFKSPTPLTEAFSGNTRSSVECASEVTVEQCREGGGDVKFNPGGYPRHCVGGVHDGKPLRY